MKVIISFLAIWVLAILAFPQYEVDANGAGCFHSRQFQVDKTKEHVHDLLARQQEIDSANTHSRGLARQAELGVPSLNDKRQQEIDDGVPPAAELKYGPDSIVPRGGVPSNGFHILCEGANGGYCYQYGRMNCANGGELLTGMFTCRQACTCHRDGDPLPSTADAPPQRRQQELDGPSSGHKRQRELDGSHDKQQQELDGASPSHRRQQEIDDSYGKRQQELDGPQDKHQQELDGSPDKRRVELDSSHDKRQQELDGPHDGRQEELDHSPVKCLVEPCL